MAKKKATPHRLRAKKPVAKHKRQVGIMLSPTAQENLIEIAESHGISKSTLVELLIRQSFRRYQESGEEYELI